MHLTAKTFLLICVTSQKIRISVRISIQTKILILLLMLYGSRMPVETVETADGEELKVEFQEHIRCEHCEYEWSTASGADRPSCSSCQRKTDRNHLGDVYEMYLKYSLFTGEEQSATQVAGRLRELATLFEAMESNGWELHQTTSSSHVVFIRGDIDPGEIIA